MRQTQQGAAHNDDDRGPTRVEQSKVEIVVSNDRKKRKLKGKCHNFFGTFELLKQYSVETCTVNGVQKKDQEFITASISQKKKNNSGGCVSLRDCEVVTGDTDLGLRNTITSLKNQTKMHKTYQGEKFPDDDESHHFCNDDNNNHNNY
jgi:hypothetical protein